MNNIFKEASRLGLTFSTSKGVLNVTQLWDLSLTDLDALAVSLEEKAEKSGKKSFLIEKSQKDKLAKLQFDIVHEILTDKLSEKKALAEKKEIKEHNDKINALIAKKKDESLEGLSVAELEAQLK